MTEVFVHDMIFLSTVALSLFRGELFLLYAPLDLHKNHHGVFT